jgi:NADH-quinone oxidoreductase subunit G
VPRPERKLITFSIDGREVQAPENTMLVDAAKLGDIEIPVFCYEPKLGAPVGACRMCLVEIEGIPKLQTGCSTPVKDGMVVHTATERVADAQAAVVEFLLVNHPLDCPVCDKGGECPLQDVSFGWGGGKTRFIEPKRHFKKPLELSPLVAIDRERCILCYRCVRFSQEVAEDYQLVLHERGAATFVGTFDGHPYVAPFSGNIIELCPVGALTSRPYRFRARPWDIEQAGSVCTLCPSQCNVAFTVRDDRVLRVMARDNHAVDDGWLCDKGRFAYQSIHADDRITVPMVRDGGVLREVDWERALSEAASALAKADGRIGGLAGGETTNEEAFLFQRLLRDVHGSPHLDSRSGATLGRDALLALDDPALQATVEDLEFAHTVLVLGTEPVDDSPILDLRLRKGVRRNHAQLAVATPRPSSLDPNATLSVRYAPGAEAAFVAALSAAFYGGAVEEPARAAGADPEAVTELATLLRTSGGDTPGDIVVLYGERVLAGGEAVTAPLLKLAGALGLAGRAGAGLLAVPSATNARGMREAGVLPDAGPGHALVAGGGRAADGIAEAAAAGELTVLYLLHTDPLRDQPQRATWDRALEKATHVIAHASFLTPGLREHATVVFPAESYAEKEGTIVHPEGRLQRLRPAIGRPAGTRAEWQVLDELGRRAGADHGVWTVHSATQQLIAAVPFYAGLTTDTIGAKGTRWWESAERAAAWPQPTAQLPAGGATAAGSGPAAPAYEAAATPNGALRLGTFKSIWASAEVAASPALKFLHPEQRVELSPADAERLGLRHGERVTVGDDGGSVEAVVELRNASPAGSAFLQEGIPVGAANTLEGPLVEIRKAARP